MRSTVVVDGLAPAIRGTIQKADPDLPTSAVRTMKDVVDLQTAARSTQIQLVAAFAALSDYYRACGGIGLQVDFEREQVEVGDLLHV